MRTLFVPALLLLAGCNAFDFLSPTSVQGVLVGVEATDGETTLGEGPILAGVYLAQATSIQDFASNLITDPDSVTLRNSGGEAALESGGDGVWVTGEDALTTLNWTVGDTLTLSLVEDGDTYTGWVDAPPAPTITGIPQAVQLDEIPTDWDNLTEQEILELLESQAEQSETHPTGTPLTVDLSAADYEYWVIVVADQNGNITFDNRPEGAQGLIDWVLEAEPIDSFEIPGSAFPDSNTLYAVGVAGIVFASGQDFDSFNWLISNLGAGTMSVAPLVTSR